MADDATEETLAHLVRSADEMSDMLAALVTRVERLERRLDTLVAREAEREVDAGGGVSFGDERPPHW